MNKNITVLGAGLIGRLLAWRLAVQGWKVKLYDSGGIAGEQSAAYVAAAMLSPLAESVDATATVVKMGRQSVQLWCDIISQLSQPVYCQQSGSLIVWHEQDHTLATQFEQRLLSANHQQVSWQSWQQQDIALNEPQLAARFKQGLFLTEEGQLDNRQVLLALGEELDEIGVECNWHTDIVAEDFLSQQQHWLLDCRGYQAKRSWNQANSQHQELHSTRLRGVRGEVLRVYAPEVSLNRPVRILHPRYPLYIAPKQKHRFVVGATQLESEDQSNVSVRSGLELMSALYALHPAFGEARIESLLTGIRPTLTHHNPEIRYCSSKKIIQINGMFRHGFMIAPALAQVANNLLDNLVSEQSCVDEDADFGVRLTKIEY